MIRGSTWVTVEDVSRRLAKPVTRMRPETIRMPDGEMSASADVLNVIGAVLAGALAADQVIMTIVQLEDIRADEQRLAKGEWALLTSNGPHPPACDTGRDCSLGLFPEHLAG